MRRLLLAMVIVVPVAATFVATRQIMGDFYATLPGGYARTLNPTLWNSPDLSDSWAFQRNSYLHGPVQYLTLYPIVFLDSYRQIAFVLLPMYAVAIAGTFVSLRASVRLLIGDRSAAVPVAANMVLFLPLLQAYVQREFEVVVLLALAGALQCLLADRRRMSAALLAYVAWFKYLPLMFVGYLGLRRWAGAVVTFLVVSAAILAASHLLFGLDGFVNNNVPATAANAFTFTRAGFCAQWSSFNLTLANVRHGLCRVESASGWPIARDLYVLVCAAIAAAYLVVHRRLSGQTLAPADERWRRALELSIVTTLYACFFFGHYYYLSALIVPLTVLLVRALADPTRRGLYPWAIAHILLSASLVPMWLLSRGAGLSGSQLYMEAPVYLVGELWLIGVLLREYGRLAQPAALTRA